MATDGKLKIYIAPDGVKRQYREGEQPAGSVEWPPAKPKAEKPKVKPKASRKSKKKEDE